MSFLRTKHGHSCSETPYELEEKLSFQSTEEEMGLDILAEELESLVSAFITYQQFLFKIFAINHYYVMMPHHRINEEFCYFNMN